MKRLVPILAAALALTACSSEPTSAPATSPYIRLPAAPGAPAAGYFELDVQGDRGALVSVSSPQAQRIEMHDSMSHGNMSSMQPIARIPTRDGERISFSEGGRHLMIFGIDPAVRPGGAMSLELHYERGENQRLTAAVRVPGQ